MSVDHSISTIVAVATPRGQGGIGVVRLSGPHSLRIARQVFLCRPVLGVRPRHVEYGHFVDAEGCRVDTGLGWFFRGPASYTGEDTVELSAHGSEAVLEAVVRAALRHGAVVAAPGEYTRRAFLNGRLDLIQAESVIDLVLAGSPRALQQAYGSASGRLGTLIRSMQEDIVTALAHLEAGLDFAEEGLEPASARQVVDIVDRCEMEARLLIEGFSGARRRMEGWMVLLAGPPNAGKSTLLNALTGEDRAIVSATAGTTRDWLETQVVWEGEKVRLIDTAGLRTNPVGVEAEGVRRTESLVVEADLVVFVVDGSLPWCQGWEKNCVQRGTWLGVFAKQDLGIAARAPKSVLCTREWLRVSAKNGTGLAALRRAIIASLPWSGDGKDEVAIVRDRHHELLSRAAECLGRARESVAEEPEKAATELQAAVRQCGMLLGVDAEEAVLDRIFSEFCVGK